MSRHFTFLQSVGLRKLATLAFAVRFILALPFKSGDLENYAVWGTYAKEFSFSGFYDFLSFGNYARPDYPPLAIILFWSVKNVWSYLFSIFWYINVAIPQFPSKFITWFDHDGYLFLLKFPGLVADFGVGFLLYWYFRKKKKPKSALLAAVLYWFNPATIYVSSMWGQVDGIIIFFALFSLMAIEQKKILMGLLLFTISILIKPTMFMISPVILYLIFKQKTSIKKVVIGFISSGVFVVLIARLFTTGNPLTWIVQKYLFFFIPAGVKVLPFIQLRAFNLWTLITGIQFVPNSTTWLGISLLQWALLISVIIFVITAVFMIRSHLIWFCATLFILGAFLFLPGVHERYMQPLFAFSLPAFIKFPKGIWIWIAMDILHLLNLYAAWQVPQTIFIVMLNFDLVARLISLSFVMIFFYLMYILTVSRRVKSV